MKYTTFILLISIFTFSSLGQVVFLETFDEVDNSTTGIDNTAGMVTWTAACPGSLDASDYLKVVGGKLEARDTNSPGATFTTGLIDISSCTGLAIGIDIEESGSLEACSDCGGTGNICVDFVQLQYDLDGAGWTDVAGTACPATMTVVPGLVIVEGDIAGGGPLAYTSPCIDFGSTIRIRVTCMSWAASEYWRFDNITVSCNDCVLPAEIINYKAQQEDERMLISWSTLTEANSNYFTIERSDDGKLFEFVDNVNAAGNSTKQIDYEIIDRTKSTNNTVYYRLNQYDFDGKMSSTKITSIKPTPSVALYSSSNSINYNIPEVTNEDITLNIYSVSGTLLVSKKVSPGYNSIPWNQKGMFICTIDELNFHQKIIF